MGSKTGVSQEPSQVTSNYVPNALYYNSNGPLHASVVCDCCPLQVIEGKSVGNGRFHTFGYSINGGLDMDENGYPDILVGSLDDSMALLR